MREQQANEFARRVGAGEFKDRAENWHIWTGFGLSSLRRKLHGAGYKLVAGAGFEPAAFRL
jgi:hypothetical protein